MIGQFRARASILRRGSEAGRGRCDARKRLLPSRPMSITVIVENDTIKLPVHVPDGTRLEITLPAESNAPETAASAPRRTLAERYAKFVGLADDMPTDLARNLDHYIHGQPRKP